MMTQQQLATLANLTIRAELCNYTGREWIQIAISMISFQSIILYFLRSESVILRFLQPNQ